MEAGASRKLTYMPELDGMRAIAIGAVMLYHFWDYGGSNVVGQAVSVVASTGWSGVDVFFAISGFLITGILLDARDRSGYFRRFFIRRSLRIFPLNLAPLAQQSEQNAFFRRFTHASKRRPHRL